MNNDGRYWTRTWNPVVGCTPVAESCANCYARVMYDRFWGRGSFGCGARPVPGRLDDPLRWRKRHRVLVPSMSDLFHELHDSRAGYAFLHSVLAVMRMTPQQMYFSPTKRPVSATKMLADADVPPNLWLGLSAGSDGELAEGRVAAWGRAPVAHRWLSLEPLIGAIHLSGAGIRAGRHRPDWIVVGGETGAHARPCHVEWILGLIRDAQEMGVPIWIKQLGGNAWYEGKRLDLHDWAGRDIDEWPEIIERAQPRLRALPLQWSRK